MAKLFISCTGQSPAFCSNNLRTPYSFGTFSCCSDKVSDKFASLWKNSPISRDKSQICWTNMYLVRFLPNFIGFRRFTWILQLWNCAKFQKPFVTGRHYGTAPVDPCHPQSRGSHHYLRAHKGSRRLSCPLIQDSSVRVLFPWYKGNLT